MARVGPTSWRDLLRNPQRLGFDGPHASGKHLEMRRAGRSIQVPNPHGEALSVGFLTRFLRQTGLRDEWDDLP